MLRKGSLSTTYLALILASHLINFKICHIAARGDYILTSSRYLGAKAALVSGGCSEVIFPKNTDVKLQHA